ncbi:scaffold attachment factor B1-like protein [Cricetulus griseus]|nr:scaffold attachment factor B1-like protein [Cricetulus griseus]
MEAIEDEGGNPDEIEVTAEGNKKMPKRPSKGKKPEDEGVEDNGLEENSGDGQEDVETSLENLQDMDMMDISVLDEADIDSGSVADCVEEEEEATLPEGLADSTELVEGDLKGLPEQLQEHAVDDKEAVNNVDTSSSDFTILQEMEEASLEPGRSSCGRNFWVSGLSSTTRATDLKNLFSRYGKVVGAKVVTNARSPGARCYGFVTMSTAEEATKCISHLHKTELHGKMISVEKAKSEPAGKRVPDRRDGDSKKEKASTSDRSANLKREEKADRKDDAKKGDDGNTEKSKDLDDQKPGPSERSRTTKSGSRGTERTVVMDKSKGVPVISVKTSGSKERASKSQDRKSASREKRSVVSFDKVKESRKSRDSESRRERERSEREQRLQAQWEREERERLEIARERLAFHRHRLERERMERERLERERMHVEQERRREQERIHREREELRRQQELRYEQERRPAVRRPYDVDGRRDDAYWPEAKRAALDDRYHSDFGRQDRFHDFDHRDRGRYPNHSVDSRRLEDDRAWQGAADGGMMEREHKRWQGGERSMSGHSGPGHMMNRGGMSGRGSFAPGGASRGHVIPRGGMQGGFGGQSRGSRPSDARFTRRY